MSFRRGIGQDGGGRDRGIKRRRRAHHRYAVAMARGELHWQVIAQECRWRRERVRQHHRR